VAPSFHHDRLVERRHQCFFGSLSRLIPIQPADIHIADLDAVAICSWGVVVCVGADDSREAPPPPRSRRPRPLRIRRPPIVTAPCASPFQGRPSHDSVCLAASSCPSSLVQSERSGTTECRHVESAEKLRIPDCRRYQRIGRTQCDPRPAARVEDPSSTIDAEPRCRRRLTLGLQRRNSSTSALISIGLS